MIHLFIKKWFQPRETLKNKIENMVYLSIWFLDKLKVLIDEIFDIYIKNDNKSALNLCGCIYINLQYHLDQIGIKGIDYLKGKLFGIEKMFGLWLINNCLKDEGIISLTESFERISMLKVLLLGSINVL